MTPKIDFSDPLYIGASQVSGAILIPIKLVGSKNYEIWSRSMRIALLGKRKYGFVNGACSKDSYKKNCPNNGRLAMQLRFHG